MTLLPNLKLLVGGRYDFVWDDSEFIADTSIDSEPEQTEFYDDAFSPRIGIVYQPLAPISLYASYSRSFVPNNDRTASGVPLEPSRSTQYEVGVKAEFGALSATLAAYEITKTNVPMYYLLFTSFTGFAWNLGTVDPLIRAITFSPPLPDLVSQPIAGQSPLPLSQQVETAQLALPDGTLRSIDLTTDPKASLRLRMKLPQEREEYGMSNIYLDQYSGQVLRVENSLKAPPGDRILNSFTPLHFGTFGGLPTRILYVFVGVAPLILFITGFVMWGYRKKSVK